MTGGAPRVHPYPGPAGDEIMLAWGRRDGPQAIVLQPLFEEMNRCRALVSALCRRLAAAGIGCWLPDLPGTGESVAALDTIGWEDWQEAVRAAALVIGRESGARALSIALRGGALLDAGFDRRWRFAPAAGAALLTDLRRSALAGDGDTEAPAGYRLARALRDGIAAAVPIDGARTLRLVTDTAPADAHVEGAPLWRRPEPVAAPALADALAADIAAWAGR